MHRLVRKMACWGPCSTDICRGSMIHPQRRTTRKIECTREFKNNCPVHNMHQKALGTLTNFGIMCDDILGKASKSASTVQQMENDFTSSYSPTASTTNIPEKTQNCIHIAQNQRIFLVPKVSPLATTPKLLRKSGIVRITFNKYDRNKNTIAPSCVDLLQAS